MAKKSTLPAAVHDHFRKANKLHTYVEKELGEARNHALEIGKELLAAKACVPHGGWENECGRLFDGSLRTAQFYMAFAKDFGKLKSAGKAALLFLECTLEGSAKAAKKLANPNPPPKPKSPPPPEIIDVDSEPVSETTETCPTCKSEDLIADGVCVKCGPVDLGKCPTCAGTKWEEDEDGVTCAKCRHPHGEPAGDVDEDRMTTQRQKTVKTLEAAMRAFDDLQCMKARAEHSGVIDDCKRLLKIAKAWK